jgi:NAD(P)-dependent dehydrogenase (short-subunit alcohol dehydrogenase family)
MKDLKGKVAVITGGASGLGRAMAERFAAEGMSIVLADVEPNALAKAEGEMKAAGANVVGVRTDVSKAADVEALAQKTLAAFGAVHLLANNAGVAEGGNVWDSTVADWEWVLGVNVWGVIHGVRVFTPIMLQQGGEGHIINTASVAGLISPPGMGIYCVSKHAVVTLSECLHHDLAQKTDRIKCSVLCPAYVPTGIADSGRNRPTELKQTRQKTEAELAFDAGLKRAVQSGKLSAADVAQKVYEAVRDERFYILTHPKIKPSIQWRMEDILQERNPTNPMGG